MSHMIIASTVRRIANLKLPVYVKIWYILDWTIEVPHYSYVVERLHDKFAHT